MTKRVCFIGDSHIAALGLASKLDAFAGMRDRMAMFGARGNALTRSVIRNNMLTSDDPDVRRSLTFTGGADHIDLAAYDIFCVVGCRVNYASANRVCASHSSHKLGLSGRQLVSDGLFDILLISRFKQALAGEVIDMLAAATDKPIYLIPDPLWSSAVLGDGKGAILGEVMRLGRQEMFADWVFRNRQAAFANKVTVLRQPADTTQDSCFTIPAYSSGSVRLAERAVEHPGTDFAHMNAAYGERVLQAFFARIDSETQAEPTLP